MMEGTGRARKTAPARLALLGRVLVGLMLVTGVSVAMLGQATVAHGATTSTSTTQSYFVTTDKQSYTGNATILVSGVAPSFASGIGVQILQPKGTVVADNSVGPAQNSSFTTSFQAGGPGWNVTGKYYVLCTAAIPDSIAAPTTFNATFEYTAVATTTSTSTSTVTSSSQTSTSGGGLSIGSVLPIVVAVVVVVALMGFLLRSRGRRSTRMKNIPKPTQTSGHQCLDLPIRFV